MCQQNLKYKTERDVRRRPRFVSAQDVKSKIKGYDILYHLSITCTHIKQDLSVIQCTLIYCVLIRSESPDSSASSAVEVPPYWDKGALDNFTYKVYSPITLRGGQVVIKHFGNQFCSVLRVIDEAHTSTLTAPQFIQSQLQMRKIKVFSVCWKASGTSSHL